MGLLFDIIPELDETGEGRFITPEQLQHYTSYEDNPEAVARRVTESLEAILEEIGCPDGIAKIRNIQLTLIMQKEVINRLLETYSEVYRLSMRMEQLLSSGMFNEENQTIIRTRVESIVDEQLFQTQRDVFFKIVNAREVAEGEKNIDGPALLFPGIEKLKNQIIQQIERQAGELGPVAVSLCKSFQGIADSYVEAEERVNERERYDSIYHTFGQERRLRKDFINEVSPARLKDTDYIDSLINAFESLKAVYRAKSESLMHIADPLSMEQFRKKTEILERGSAEVDQRLKPLQVLKRMTRDFPRLVKQLDFFADSHYQARAVFRVLEEVKEEMNHVFKRYDIDSITVVGFLKYKLNGISHMYESIHYYYAAIQIETDMVQAFRKQYEPENDIDADAAVSFRMEGSGIPGMIRSMHEHLARMNQENYDIHRAFLEYKENRDLISLKTSLKDKTLRINSLYKNMKRIYRNAQRVFAGFLIEDLGATDLESQLNTCLKKASDTQEVKAIQKGIKTLLATRKKKRVALEKQVAEQFSGNLDKDKVSAIASLKIKKDFIHELLLEVQPYPKAQDAFLELLKAFIKLRDDEEHQNPDDPSNLWSATQSADGAFERFAAEMGNPPHHSNTDTPLSQRELAAAFLDSNITPHEIESFSRLLPVLPRNELHLDSTFGRLLLDIIRQYMESIRSRGGAATHLIERIYEKRERSRLISNICILFQTVAEPFLEKIEKEEKKSNHLIRLQRIKYRKELGEIIRYWQYLIQEQIEPGQGQRGRFRRYSEDEKKMMMKYISPEQLELIDQQLAAGFDLREEAEIQAVESFLMEIVQGLFKRFQRDDRIRSEFEAFVISKKVQLLGENEPAESDLLSSRQFMPNIRMRLQSAAQTST